jgi:hypothetical protein
MPPRVELCLLESVFDGRSFDNAGAYDEIVALPVAAAVAPVGGG